VDASLELRQVFLVVPDPSSPALLPSGVSQRLPGLEPEGGGGRRLVIVVDGVRELHQGQRQGRVVEDRQVHQSVSFQGAARRRRR
jgi:hypothetical protein